MVSYLWLIPLLPALGFVVNGLLGARLRKTAVSAVACGSVLASFILAIACVAELAGVPVHERHLLVSAGEWIAPLGLSWSFLLDPLSAVMILIVTGVGLLIHVYSIGYMW